MSKFRAWIVAFRLRTLPLALSSIVMGSFVAAFYHQFKWEVALLAGLTTLFLQILSNLANDYGDTQNGADHEGRKGPQRMVQSGAILPVEMKRMIIVFAVLSFVAGIGLIALSLGDVMTWKALAFLLLGIGAIAAAMKYTMGKNPYGYRGLGDVYVFVFFGLVGVVGTWFLHSGQWNSWVLLPASAVGLLSAGVLNLNNMRDFESDRTAGKNTLVVKLGVPVARRYHLGLLVTSFTCLFVFVLFHPFSWFHLLFLTAAVLIIAHARRVVKVEELEDLDPELKRLALSTLLIVLLFGTGLLIG